MIAQAFICDWRELGEVSVVQARRVMELMMISTVASDVDTCCSCNCMLIFVLRLYIMGADASQ